MAVHLQVNGKSVSAQAEPATPLLWVLRDELDLVGTKFGCGAGLCGACTVHVNGKAVRSCQTPLGEAGGKKVATIESLGRDNSHPLQKAWIKHDVPQCGYCQSGQLMSAAALLASNKNPSDAQIDEAMSGNLCRCGTYVRVRAAIKTAAAEMRGANG
jgi:isoquinoline 1-oxidoreductase alpha subunit